MPHSSLFAAVAAALAGSADAALPYVETVLPVIQDYGLMQPFVYIDDETLDLVRLMAEGWTGGQLFMDEKTLLRTLHHGGLSNGSEAATDADEADGADTGPVSPMPFVLPCVEGVVERAQADGRVQLIHDKYGIVAEAEVSQIYKDFRGERLLRTIGSEDPGHPAVRRAMQGDLQVVAANLQDPSRKYNEQLDVINAELPDMVLSSGPKFNLWLFPELFNRARPYLIGVKAMKLFALDAWDHHISPWIKNDMLVMSCHGDCRGNEAFLPKAVPERYYQSVPQLQKRFAEYDAVVAFQVRNPIHNGHVLLMRMTLDEVRAEKLREGIARPKVALWLSPVGGVVKDDDVPLSVRLAQHEALIEEEVFGEEVPVVLSVFPSPLWYVGPREAQWHALARQRAGATHYIVGRDPAGVKDSRGTGDLYQPFHVAEALRGLQVSGELTLKLVDFRVAAYHKPSGAMQFVDPDEDSENYLSISGTEMRAMAKAGETPPPGFMNKEGWDLLVSYYENGEPALGSELDVTQWKGMRRHMRGVAKFDLGGGEL